VCVIVMVACLAAWAYRGAGRVRRGGVLCIGLIVVGAGLFTAARWVITTRATGQAYSGKTWTESETIRRIRALPANMSICTNDAFAVYFLTGRRPFGVPVRFDPMSNRPNPGYALEMRGLRDRLDRDGGVLVWWRFDGPSCLASEREILGRMDLRVLFDGPDGRIYQMRH
jgi:hypothetical protein